MLEKYLIEHCSPTLASLKTANLFTFSYNREAELSNQLNSWNQKLSGRGIELAVLRKRGNTALIYVCRKSKLKKDLADPETAEFLSGIGYIKTDAEYALQKLKSRLKHQDFPHEIGVFLGYPLKDVIGFIENSGQNCKCSGCWKVYCNECEAVRIFAKFKKCKEVYTRLWNQGRSIMQLTVAA